MYKVNKKIIKKLTPIEVFDLSVLQGKNKILDRISCKIKDKSITAVIGPNGAGKTFFLHTINGLTDIKNGKILFNQIGNNQEIRKKQALVFQTPILLRRNVRANMDFVSSVHTKDVSKFIENILKSEDEIYPNDMDEKWKVDFYSSTNWYSLLRSIVFF